MISIFVLDLDGPLLDGMDRHYSCYRDILSGFGFAPIPAAEYWEMKRNRVNRRELLAMSGAASTYNAFLEAWISKIETKEYLRLDRLQREVVAVLSGWRREGRRLVLATLRNNRANLEWQLDQLGLVSFFSDIVVVGNHKDALDKAAEVGSLLQCKPEDVMWIGDTEVDMAAARRLGVSICLLTCGLRSREFLLQLDPDVLADDLYSFATKI